MQANLGPCCSLIPGFLIPSESCMFLKSECEILNFSTDVLLGAGVPCSAFSRRCSNRVTESFIQPVAHDLSTFTKFSITGQDQIRLTLQKAPVQFRHGPLSVGAGEDSNKHTLLIADCASNMVFTFIKKKITSKFQRHDVDKPHCNFTTLLNFAEFIMIRCESTCTLCQYVYCKRSYISDLLPPSFG
jgi:hypothetical protein